LCDGSGAEQPKELYPTLLIEPSCQRGTNTQVPMEEDYGKEPEVKTHSGGSERERVISYRHECQKSPRNHSNGHF